MVSRVEKVGEVRVGRASMGSYEKEREGKQEKREDARQRK